MNISLHFFIFANFHHQSDTLSKDWLRDIYFFELTWYTDITTKPS